MADTNLIDITVLVAETHKDDLEKVTKDLMEKGFVLKQSLAEIGALTGSAPAAAVEKLQAVPGVEAVEKERTDYRPQE